MSMEDWLRNVPSYALYGEEIDEIIPERMHCESIAERSELYEWEIRPHRHQVFFQNSRVCTVVVAICRID